MRLHAHGEKEGGTGIAVQRERAREIIREREREREGERPGVSIPDRHKGKKKKR